MPSRQGSKECQEVNGVKKCIGIDRNRLCWSRSCVEKNGILIIAWGYLNVFPIVSGGSWPFKAHVKRHKAGDARFGPRGVGLHRSATDMASARTLRQAPKALKLEDGPRN